MKTPTLPAIGFSLSLIGAIVGGWTYQELTWGFWISGLCSSLLVICIGFLQSFYSEPIIRLQSSGLSSFIFQGLLNSILKSAFFALAVIGHLILFGIYGAFLSFFASMEPSIYFGVNGFINSNFIDPVWFLITNFSLMILGSLTNIYPLKGQGLSLMFQPGLIRLHLAVVMMPFVILLLWFLVGADYQTAAVVAIIGLFYVPSGAGSASKI